MIGKRNAALFRLSLRGFIGEHDIAEKTAVPVGIGGERQHVGRRILAAPQPVEVAYLLVGNQHQGDAEGSPRARRGAERRPRRPP